MNAIALLTELHRLGAVAYRAGDCIRVRPASAVPPELFERLRTHKADLLRVVPVQAGTETGSPVLRGPCRVVIEDIRLVHGAVRLPDGCTTITDPMRCIEKNLTDLECAMMHENAGRKTAFAQLIEEHVARLAACGCRVRVERVS